MSQHIEIDLENNFDLTASVEFEFDEALYTLALTEFTKEHHGGITTEQSHQQSPLAFRGNNDHYTSVRRELIADDVESEGKDKAHILTITNR